MILFVLAIPVVLATVTCLFLFTTVKGLLTGTVRIARLVRRRDQEPGDYWTMIAISGALCLVFGMLTLALVDDMLRA